MKKIENIIAYGVVVLITLISYYILCSPNKHFVVNEISQDKLIQLIVVNKSYPDWNRVYYIVINSALALSLLGFFVLVSNTIVKLSCLAGIVFFLLLIIFNLGLSTRYYEWCNNINFERSFGVSAIIVLIAFYVFKK